MNNTEEVMRKLIKEAIKEYGKEQKEEKKMFHLCVAFHMYRTFRKINFVK